MTIDRDPSLDALLGLDGEIFVIDPDGGHWVKFEVKRTDASAERPHGLRYSMTLHAADGTRLVGYDNAHAAPGYPPPHDHRHRLRTIRPYEYRDAATLLADFWASVDVVLAERGVKL